MTKLFMIVEGRAYYRRDTGGYTFNRQEAELYTEEEAKKICDNSDSGCIYKPVSALFKSKEYLSTIIAHLERIKEQVEEKEEAA